MLLIDQKPYNKITVSDIAKKAGIARQTFYRHYNKKNDIIEQYLVKSFNMELSVSKNSEGDEKKPSLVLTFNLGYIIGYKDNLMKIVSRINSENLFSSRILQERINDLIDRYKDNLSVEEYLIYRYSIYQWIVGSIYVLADWLKNDMPLSIEKLRPLLNSFVLPDSSQYKYVPNIIIRLKTG
jgi:hypothetical protein